MHHLRNHGVGFKALTHASAQLVWLLHAVKIPHQLVLFVGPEAGC